MEPKKRSMGVGERDEFLRSAWRALVADLAVDHRRQREGGAGKLPVFPSPGVVWVGEELAVAAVAAFGVLIEQVSR